jgi:hypothetical protein
VPKQHHYIDHPAGTGQMESKIFAHFPHATHSLPWVGSREKEVGQWLQLIYIALWHVHYGMKTSYLSPVMTKPT